MSRDRHSRGGQPASRPRFTVRDVGPATIGALVAAEALLWALARPPGENVGSYLGQLLGAESILVLSIALVLISTLPWVEEWFQAQLRLAGVPAKRIHWEQFDWR